MQTFVVDFEVAHLTILMVRRSLYRASYLKTLVAKGLISSLAE